MMQAEPLLDARCAVGESPVWDAAQGILWWVDIPAGRVHRLDLAGLEQGLDVGQPVGAVALRARGGLVLAVADGFTALDPATARLDPIASVEADRDDTRMNDGKCDAGGRFWAGTLAHDFRSGAGTLYRLETSGKVTAQVTGVTCSNGLDWSPDGRTMYYVDSVPGVIYAFDFDPDAGSISRRRVLVEATPGNGNPDGLTVDAEGYLWVAMWDGWAVRRYAPDGRLQDIVPIPVGQVTSCTFGGVGLDEVYVTTARQGLSAEEVARQPLAGGIFRISARVSGRPAHAFAG
jgi:sugar lactone lactonase YvrE